MKGLVEDNKFTLSFASLAHLIQSDNVLYFTSLANPSQQSTAPLFPPPSLYLSICFPVCDAPVAFFKLAVL